jgi:hypothetical protein
MRGFAFSWATSWAIHTHGTKCRNLLAEETLKDVREWDVMMTTGELFPTLDPQAVRNIRAPVLMLSGEKSYPFLGLIDEELARLLPHNRRIILPGATHRMWFEQPDGCRSDVLEFLRGDDSHAKPRASAQHFEFRSSATTNLTARWWNDAVHADIFDQLTVMVGNVPQRRVQHFETIVACIWASHGSH